MLAEREPPSQLVQGKTDHYVFYFIPDNIKFGRWRSRSEADDAIDVWRKDYARKPQANWQSYCRAKGFQSVEFI
jgi:hypothetical protein